MHKAGRRKISCSAGFDFYEKCNNAALNITFSA